METLERTISARGTEVTYNANMPMRHLKKLLGGATDSDLNEIVAGLTQFVISWGFTDENGKPLDPTDPEAWDDLGRLEFNATLRGITEDLGSLGEG